MILLFAVVNVISLGQDACEFELSEAADAIDGGFLFLVSSEREQEIWLYDFNQAASNNLEMTLPIDAWGIALSPQGDEIAFAMSNYDEVAAELTVNLLNIETGNTRQVFAGDADTQITQIVDLHWISESQLGFVSNGPKQQYTIVDVNEGIAKTFRAEIPIPELNVLGGSIWGDWDIKFSPSFLNAAFLHVLDYQSTITFWNLNTKNKVDIDYQIPVRWVANNRAYSWIDDDRFLVRNQESNWLEVSLKQNLVQKMTDAGSLFQLDSPIIAPDGSSIAFLVRDIRLDSFSTMLGIWRNGELALSCIKTTSGQLQVNSEGWDDTSRYFVFSVYDYENAISEIYLLDVTRNQIADLYLLDFPSTRVSALGWVDG
ncbi:MAG: hypothetical protein KC708_08065 [Anaerolineae bacterium]|nr:hypothetical protein [Anaerolineae bacterium]